MEKDALNPDSEYLLGSNDREGPIDHHFNGELLVCQGWCFSWRKFIALQAVLIALYTLGSIGIIKAKYSGVPTQPAGEFPSNTSSQENFGT